MQARELQETERVAEWTEQVLLAQRGDLAAFEAVVARFQDMAVAYGYSILGDFQLAQDAAQEAFIAAYYDLPRLRQAAAFPAWLRRIVFKHCDRYSRCKRPPAVALEATADLADPEQEPFAAVERRLEQEAVLATVSALPDAERAATALYYINGYSMSEVGQFLDVPLSTVKNRLHSARKRLREGMVGLVEETLKQHAPGSEFSTKVRNLLEGIERVHWETTSVLCFTGSLAASMRFLVGRASAAGQVSNDYVMGVSGGAFKMFWIPPWSPANCDLLIIGEEPIRQAFAALGYDYTFIGDFDRQNRALTKDEYKRKIVANIDAGRPVMADGVVGPPEICVVAGYDRDGEVLYGYSYFQEQEKGSDGNDLFADEEWYDSLQPQTYKGYFRSEDWYGNIYGLILIGDKREKPSPRQTLKRSLEWAVDLARVPQRPLLWPSEGASFCHSGLAAYDVMAESALRDSDFPAGDLESLTYKTYALANDGAFLMIGKRWAAAAYLDEMAGEAGAAAGDLRQAADLYRQQTKLWEKAAAQVTWSGAPEAERLKLAEREPRERFAAYVRQAKALEEQSVALLERALAAM